MKDITLLFHIFYWLRVLRMFYEHYYDGEKKSQGEHETLVVQKFVFRYPLSDF